VSFVSAVRRAEVMPDGGMADDEDEYDDEDYEEYEEDEEVHDGVSTPNTKELYEVACVLSIEEKLLSAVI
jgi:hypothetical protein